MVKESKGKWIVGIGTDKQHKKCGGRIYIVEGTGIKGKMNECMCKRWAIEKNNNM